MANNKSESMSFREGIDRMVDRATLAIGLRREISRGANELDLVRSDLDDTMRTAFQDLRTVMKTYPHIEDYRTAAYAVAISKIAQSYCDLGLAQAPVE